VESHRGLLFAMSTLRLGRLVSPAIMESSSLKGLFHVSPSQHQASPRKHDRDAQSNSEKYDECKLSLATTLPQHEDYKRDFSSRMPINLSTKVEACCALLERRIHSSGTEESEPRADTHAPAILARLATHPDVMMQSSTHLTKFSSQLAACSSGKIRA